MKALGKVIEISKMVIKVNLSYVAGFWGTILSSILQVVILYYIWNAIYAGNDVINGMEKGQMITYIILTRVLVTIFSYGINLFISDLILNGDISIELLRPIDFQLSMFSRRLGDFLIQSLAVGLPLLFISILLFGFVAPQSISIGFLFIISTFLAMVISFLVEYFAGLMTFYTTNGWGIQNLKIFIISFLSGSLVPLSFLPQKIKLIFDVLPFKNMAYTPAAIYLGIVRGQEAYMSIVMQIAWIIFLVVISRMSYNSLIKKITVNGG